MRDRDAAPARAVEALVAPVAVVGDGRMGRALVAALHAAGVAVVGPLGRGAAADDAAVVLLAVPDSEIAAAAEAVAPAPLVGHLSGATGLDALGGHESFSIHPLLTVTERGAAFEGAPAAIAASTRRARETALALAAALGMRPFEVADHDRAAYHAAASIAANFLVTVEGFAADLASTAGVDRAMLAPLVRAAVDAWESEGAERALTGPIARGDVETVSRQRAAVAERMPDRLGLFDALAAATTDLAERAATGRRAADHAAATEGGAR